MAVALTLTHAELESLFGGLATEWHDATGGLSVVSRTVSHPAYLKIIGTWPGSDPAHSARLAGAQHLVVPGARSAHSPTPGGPRQHQPGAAQEGMAPVGRSARLSIRPGMTKLAPSRERWFPAFDSADYAVTSEETIAYNCFAWALDVSAWIEPHDNEPFALFERAGYRVVSDATLEPGIQKIVVYADEVGFTHAARQLPTGRWTRSSEAGRTLSMPNRST